MTIPPNYILLVSFLRSPHESRATEVAEKGTIWIRTFRREGFPCQRQGSELQHRCCQSHRPRYQGPCAAVHHFLPLPISKKCWAWGLDIVDHESLYITEFYVEYFRYLTLRTNGEYVNRCVGVDYSGDTEG